MKIVNMKKCNMENKDEQVIGVRVMEDKNVKEIDTTKRMKSAMAHQFDEMKDFVKATGEFNPYISVYYETNSGRQIGTSIFVKNIGSKEDAFKQVFVLGAIIGGWYANKKFKKFNFAISNLHGSGFSATSKELEEAEKEFEEARRKGKLLDFIVCTALDEKGCGFTEVKEVKKKIGSDGKDMIMQYEFIGDGSHEITNNNKDDIEVGDKLLGRFFKGFDAGFEKKINCEKEENPFVGFELEQ